MKIKSTLLALAVAIGYTAHAQQQLTGAIDGVFDVSNLGAATYTIPVATPEGVGGLKPTISISYNSQNPANGNLGIGWSVAVGSAITRANSTILLEGKTVGAAITTDKFALDGSRLVRSGDLNSTSNYTYATESESYVKVEGQNTGSDFQSFKVTNQSGIAGEYGIATNSRQNISNVTYAWLLARQTDLNGNTVNYDYYNVPGEEIRIKSITYGGGSTPINRITFHYINKAAQNFVYLLGQKLDSKYKLDKITIESTGGTGNYSLLYTYQFEYTAQKDQLIKVRHISNFTNQEMPGTTFGYFPETNALGQQSVSDPDFNSRVTEDNVFIAGDFTGDGKSDVIQYCRKFNFCAGEPFFTYSSLGESFLPLQNGNLPAPPNAIKERTDVDRNLFSQFFDFNGDGKEDYVYKSYELDNGKETFNEYTILLADNNGNLLPLNNPLKPHITSSGICPPFYKSRPIVGDFDGDGKSEMFVFNERFSFASVSYNMDPEYIDYSGVTILGEKYMSYSYSNLHGAYFHHGMGLPANSGLPGRFGPENNGTERQEIFTVDYNGDGKNEILVVYNGTASVYEMNVSFDANNKPVFGSPMFIKVSEDGYPSVWHDKYFGDFNGDGVTDVLTYHDNAGWEIGYGKGNGLLSDIRGLGISNFIKPKPFTNVALKHRRRPILLADFNGDGKTDIFDYTDSESGVQAPRVLFSKGNHVFETLNLNIPSQFLNRYDQGYTVGDFNGDGKSDFLSASGNSTLQLFTIGAYEHAGKLKVTGDGQGRFGEVKYKYLSEKNNQSYYTTSTAVQYPLLNRPFPFAVVTEAAVDNGGQNGSTNISRYSYNDLIIARWGRGLLGFMGTRSVDQAHGVVSSNSGILNYDKLLLLPSISLVTKNGNDVSESRSHFEVRNLTGKRFGIYPKFTESYDYVTGQNIREDFSFQETHIVDGGGVYIESSYHIGKPIKKTTNKGFYRNSSNSLGIDGALETITETFSYPDPMPNPLFPPPLFHSYFLPSRIQTTSIRKGQSAFTADVRFSYNPDKGWLTRKRDNLGLPHAVTTNYTYNTFGNMVTQSVSSTGCPTVTDSIEYDPTNRFVKTRFNKAYPLLKSTNTYNGYTGWINTTTDNVNSIIQTFGYDGFGRPTSVTDNTGLQTTTAIGPPEQGSPDDTRYTVTQFNNVTGKRIYKNYDRLGRLLRTIRTDFNGDIIYEDMTYNILGQLMTSSLPYKAIGGTPLYTSFSYDALGRQSQISAPNGNTLINYNLLTNTSSTNNVARYTVTTTGPDSISRATKADAAGKKVEASDPGGTLSFTYHSSGQLLNTALNGSIVTSSTYNGAGRETEKYDVNYGTYQYTYDNYGKLKMQTDPKGNQYTMDYDALGNLLTKTGPEGIYTYTYNLNTAGASLGKLTGITAPGNISETYSYGSFGRLTQEVKTIDGINFTNAYAYDGFGRLSRKYFADLTQGVALNLGYNANDGSYERTYLNGGTVQNPKNLYTVLKKNVLGQATSSGFFSVLYSGPLPLPNPAENPFYKLNSFKQISNIGNLQYQETFVPNSGGWFQDINFGFNENSSNLEYRQNHLGAGPAEEFTYDNLNRLQQHFVYSAPIGNIEYSQNGNIMEKSDAGTFTYNSANKVTEIAPFTNIPSATQTITYTPFDKVETIKEGNITAHFKYWPDGQRAKMELKNNGVIYRTKYYMEDFEREISNGQTRDLVYVRGENDQYVSIVERVNNTNEKTYSVMTDYLGSVERILDNSTLAIVADKNHDAWGRERDPNDWSYLPTTRNSNGWDRGYTGHEHIPEFGIINMNGRLYDPVLGRMLSPDPYIMGTDNTQGYNRYAYAMNNPMSYTDPSGNVVWFVPLIYAAVNVAMDLSMNNGKMSFGQIALSAGMGALGGLTSGATSVAGAIVGAGLSQVNRIMPNIPIYQSGNFSLGISPMIGMGSSGLNFGASLNVGGRVGNLSYAASIGAGFNSGMSSLGDAASGSYYWNGGGFLGYNHGSALYGAGYSYNSFFGGKTDQGVGAVHAQIGGFAARFDEDFLGDGGDRYRTGGLLLSYKVGKNVTLAFGGSMTTGNAIKTGNSPIDYCTTCGPNGTWSNEDINLRGGTMYGGIVYKGQSSFYGSNKESRLHKIQNYIHKSRLLNLGTPYFQDLGYRNSSYFYSGSYHKLYLFY